MRIRTCALGACAVTVMLAAALVRPIWAQDPPDLVRRIADLRAAGRPWHAAQLGSADSTPAVVLAEATSALASRRYERAETLLIHRTWLDEEGGKGRAALAEAEAHLGLWAAAAGDFEAARRVAPRPAALVLAARAGAAFEAAGALDSAAEAFAAARAGGLSSIADWLRLREARVTRDTARAFALLAGLSPVVARGVAAARADALLAAGDTARALGAFAAAGQPLDVGELALAAGDTARARDALYGLMERAPESDAAGVALGWALARLPARSGPEHVALARALKAHGAPSDGLLQAEGAVAGGDSSGSTLVLLGDLYVATGRTRAGVRAYAAAASDSAIASVALYARARALFRLHDPTAFAALGGFAERYPADTAAPQALFLFAQGEAEAGDSAGARGAFQALLAHYVGNLHASRARFQLAADAVRRGFPDSAVAWYQAEVAAGPQRMAARYWLGCLANARRDSSAAQAIWGALAHDDSVGYYGLRARAAAGLPALRVSTNQAGTPLDVAVRLGALDTLKLAGLDSEADAEVAGLLDQPPAEAVALLAWSRGLADRGWGPAAIRLAWLAAQRAPGDSGVLRAIFPWPARTAVEAEAQEFGIDPFLLAALVRQESEFNPDARSVAGARGLAQLLPSTAAATARAMNVAFDPAWITVPDLNLHLGAAHLARLLRLFDGRVDAAVAAYDAGAPPVERWLARPGAADRDHFIELIPYDETRGYTRAVLRNWTLYRALYGPPND